MAWVVLCLSSAFEFRFHLEKFAFRVLLSKCVRIYVFLTRMIFISCLNDIPLPRRMRIASANKQSDDFFKFVFVFNTSAAITLKHCWFDGWSEELKTEGERLKWKVITSNENSSGSSEKGERLSLDTPDLKLLKNSASSSPHQVSLVYRMNKL